MKEAPPKRQTGGAGDEENKVKIGGNKLNLSLATSLKKLTANIKI